MVFSLSMSFLQMSHFVMSITLKISVRQTISIVDRTGVLWMLI
jgi:hypothetical protein